MRVRARLRARGGLFPWSSMACNGQKRLFFRSSPPNLLRLVDLEGEGWGLGVGLRFGFGFGLGIGLGVDLRLG